MKIYYLKWVSHSSSIVPQNGVAYTDLARAKKHADLNNANRRWHHRLSGSRWVIGTLKLIEGE